MACHHAKISARFHGKLHKQREMKTLGKVIVSKFGEYTFATHERIEKAADILKSDPSRRYAVATAPGRRTPDDIKITDLLCMAHANSVNNENFMDPLTQVRSRFEDIIKGLGIDFDLETEFADIKKNLFFRKNLDYIASRGEYLISKIFAKFLGWEFIDASKLIFFEKDGSLNLEKTLSTASGVLKNVEHAVIPSFYGSINANQIKTFAREDCDTTGALIAEAVKADLLERWTEPKSILVADPAIVKDPLAVRNMTYAELVQITYMGLEVVNDLALFHLFKSEITMSIRMIDNVDDPGVLVTKELPAEISRNPVACITGKTGYRVIHIEKFGVNKTAGFMQKLFTVFTKRNISCEHCLTGIHRISLFLKNLMFDLRRNDILNEIKNAIEPDELTVDNDVSLIALIGQGMNKAHGTFTKILDALAKEKIEVRMIDQGSDDVNIFLGVHDADYEKAIKALYDNIILNKEA